MKRAVRQPSGDTCWTFMGAFANLLKSFLGIGLLTFPFAASLVGLPIFITGTIIIVLLVRVSMLLLLWTDDAIERSSVTKVPKHRTYPIIVQLALASGGGCAGKAIYWSCLLTIVLGQLGTLVGYLQFLGSNLSQLLPSLSLQQAVFAAAGIALLPSLIPKMRALSPFSAVGMLSLFSALIAFAVYCGSIAANGTGVFSSSSNSLQPRASDVWWQSNWSGLFRFAGICLFAAEGITALPSVKHSLTKERKHSANGDLVRLLDIALVIMTALLLAFGIFGWSCLGVNPPSIVTQGLVGNTPVTRFIKASLTLYILCTYPLQLYPAAEAVQELFFASCSTSTAVERHNHSYRAGRGGGGGGGGRKSRMQQGSGKTEGGGGDENPFSGISHASGASEQEEEEQDEDDYSGSSSGSDDDADDSDDSSDDGGGEVSSPAVGGTSSSDSDSGNATGTATAAETLHPPGVAGGGGTITPRRTVSSTSSNNNIAANNAGGTSSGSSSGQETPARSVSAPSSSSSNSNSSSAPLLLNPLVVAQALGKGKPPLAPSAASASGKDKPFSAGRKATKEKGGASTSGSALGFWQSCCGGSGGSAASQKQAKKKGASNGGGLNSGSRRLLVWCCGSEILRCKGGCNRPPASSSSGGGGGGGRIPPLCTISQGPGKLVFSTFVRTAFVVISATIASQLKSFGVVISFIGWLAFGVLSFVLPPLMYVTLVPAIFPSAASSVVPFSSAAASASAPALASNGSSKAGGADGDVNINRGDHWWVWVQRVAGKEMRDAYTTSPYTSTGKGKGGGGSNSDEGQEEGRAKLLNLPSIAAASKKQGETTMIPSSQRVACLPPACYSAWCSSCATNTSCGCVCGCGTAAAGKKPSSASASSSSSSLSVWSWERLLLWGYLIGGTIISIAGMVMVVIEATRDSTSADSVVGGGGGAHA